MKVIQTWDDGLVSDIRLIEILCRYQVKATFCLNPGLYQENRSFEWMHENREVCCLSIHELVNDAMWENFESTINRISSDSEAEWAFVRYGHYATPSARCLWWHSVDLSRTTAFCWHHPGKPVDLSE